MTTTWVPSARAGGGGPNGGRERGAVARRRQRLRLLAGAGVMVASVAGFWATAVASGGRTTVLALARPVAVGQVLTAADVRTVSIGAHSGVPVLAASRRTDVLGRPVSSSLPAGALLSDDALATTVPSSGQALATVALKSGRVPPTVGAGEQVVLTETKPGTPAEDAVRGVVLDSRPGTGGVGTTLVTVQCDQASAMRAAQLQEPALVVLAADAPAGR
ncbi:SAF domain-containing protein [Kitasatospora viridis]|uniref:SAF domain-containing protein n=1 Tax=Kitasatospora viridis TaxID=281105 RepID=A0A561TVZ6_9ACTN|nr:SAF domain-containing protein [Kitasatospora viridis]TWF91285.1 SAF domain-containing protein [Kitasatospora viridis]